MALCTARFITINDKVRYRNMIDKWYTVEITAWLLGLSYIRVYSVSQKNNTLDFWSITSIVVDQFIKLFHYQETLCNYCRVFYLALTVLLHYFAKFKNLK